MKRLLLVLGLLLGFLPAQAQMMSTGIGGGGFGGGAAAYVGPGDVKSGWKVFYGVRAYDSATRGTKLVQLCDSTGGTDANCTDANSSATTGSLVIPGILSGVCPGPNCTIKTFYDLSGAGSCTTTCDLTQTTISSRAILTANAVGSISCGVSSTAVYGGLLGFATQAEPYSVTGVVKYASTSGAFFYLGTGGSNNGWGIASSAWFMYAPSDISGGTPNTSSHAIQSVVNGASSSINVDSTQVATGNSGAGNATNYLFFFSDGFSQKMNGALCESGIYPAAFNGTDLSNMRANQSAYYGTP